MDKKIACDSCLRSYKNKRSLTRHFREKHNTEGTQHSIEQQRVTSSFAENFETNIHYDLKEYSRRNYLKVIVVKPKTKVIDTVVLLQN